MFIRTPLLTAALAGAALSAAPAASAERVIDFSSVPAGTLLTEQIDGVTVSANNANPDSPDAAITFDFNADPRFFESGQFGPDWSMGNIDLSTDLGNGVAIQGSTFSVPFETERPAGTLIFDFDSPLDSFGFTVVDVEGPEEFVTDTGFFIEFLSGGDVITEIDFEQFVNSGSDFFDPNIAFGNRSANRIAPITAAQLGVASFDEVQVSLGGSSIVAQITVNEAATAVPSPTAAAAGLALLGGLLARRRKQA